MHKNLVISPHIDDEVLGCGGILDKDSFVYYCGIDESRLPSDPKHRISIEERLKEAKAVANFLGFDYEINYKSKVNFYIEQDFIAEIERLINKIRPEKIFIPYSGYNQDHRTIFNASQVALRRHDKNFFVKKVLVYEAIHDFLQMYKKLLVNYFIPIDIKRKLKSYSLHQSQVRGMRSMEMIEYLAKLRGAASNCEFAEAFDILRWVN